MVDPGDHRVVGWRCRVLGHRLHFTHTGPLMRWECERGCGLLGSKRYLTTNDASRYAAAFDLRHDRDLGRRAPLIGLFPLRLWRRLRQR